MSETFAVPRPTAEVSAREPRRVVAGAPWVLLLVALVYLVLWPVLNFELKGFTDNGFARMASHPGLGEVLRTTVVLGGTAAALALMLGTTLAFCTTRLSRRIRPIAVVLPLLPLVVPSVAMISGWSFLLSERVGYVNRWLRMTPPFDHLDTGPIDVYSMQGIVMVLTFSLTSFVFVFVENGLRAMGADYEMAAASCGSSPARTFFRVTLPLLRPSIVYGGSVALLLGLGTFTAPLLLGSRGGIRVLTTEIFALREVFPVDYPLAAALSLPVLVLGVVIVAVQRLLLRNQRRFELAQRSTSYANRERSSKPALAIMFFYLGWAVVLPLLALVHVSLSRFWTGQLTFDALTFEHYQDLLFENTRVRDAISTSLWASVSAIAVLIPLGFVCALSLQERYQVPRVVRSAIDTIVSLPLGISATLLGLGLLYTYTRPPFVLYGTELVLVLTYVTLMVSHATRLQFSTLLGLGNDSIDAARASGAGPIRTLLRVTVPLTRKGMAAAAALMLILLFDEFTASVMVRAPSTQTMGTVMWDLWRGGLAPEVAVMALIMVGVSAIGIVSTMLLAGRDALRGV